MGEIKDTVKISVEKYPQEYIKKELQKLKKSESIKNLTTDEEQLYMDMIKDESVYRYKLKHYQVASKLMGKSVESLLETEDINISLKDKSDKESKERIGTILKFFKGVKMLKQLSICLIGLVVASPLILGGCSSEAVKVEHNQGLDSNELNDGKPHAGGDVNILLTEKSITNRNYDTIEDEGIGSNFNKKFGVTLINTNISGQNGKTDGVSAEIALRNYEKESVKITLTNIQIDNVRYKDVENAHATLGSTDSPGSQVQGIYTLIIENKGKGVIPNKPEELRFTANLRSSETGKKLSSLKMKIPLQGTNIFE